MSTQIPDPSRAEADAKVLGPHGANSAVAWSRRHSVRVGLGWHLPHTFTALRHRNFRIFWIGQLVSLIGTWMQIIAQGWLVYQLTGSGLLLGTVAFASSMPSLLFAIPAGVWVDRYNKQAILLGTQVAAMLLAFALAWLVWAGAIQVWHIVALAFLLGCVNALDAPARQAIVPDIASKQDLMNAIALTSTAMHGARVIGPAVAGILVGVAGIASAFFINGVSFLAVIVALLMIRLPAAAKRKERRSMWVTALEGMDYVRTHPTILALIGLMGMSSLFGLSYMTIMPLFAGDVLNLGATGYGVLMSANGIGAVVAALALASLGNFRAKGALLTLGNLVFPVALLALAVSRWLPLTLLALLVAGWASVSQGALTNTLIQAAVPDDLRGRVLSMYLLVFFGLMPFGSIFMGTVAQWTSAPVAVALGAIITLGFAIFVFLRVPRLRSLE